MTSNLYSARADFVSNEQRRRSPNPVTPAALSSASSEVASRDGSIAWLFAIYLGGFATIALTTLVGLLRH